MEEKGNRTSLQKFKRALFDADLDLAGLAQQVDYSVSHIAKISSGHKRPGRRAILRIEKVLSARIWSTPRQFRRRLERLAQQDVMEFDEVPPAGRGQYASPFAVLNRTISPIRPETERDESRAQRQT
jgi:hypothetical protein